jgi:protein-disulfide isomerase
VSSPLSLLLTIATVVFAGLVISAFRVEQTTSAAQEPAYPALTDQQRSDLEKWWALQPKVDLGIPSDGAVVVVKFSDFMCPACRQAYEWYKPIVAKYEPAGKVRFVVKHYPLEAECNKHAPSNHYASCEAAAAVVMARATGKTAALEGWLFSNQQSLTPQTVKAAARDIGGIADFDAQYARALEEVTADANLGGQLGVNRTPTFYIAGRKLPNESLLPPQYFEYLVELALRGTT